MNVLHSSLIIAVISAVTLILRFLPFVLFKNRELPKFAEQLGKSLPYAVMGMLVVYCLRGAEPLTYPYTLPELISCLLTAALYVWKRNSMLSIVSGTVCYMLLSNAVFV